METTVVFSIHTARSPKTFREATFLSTIGWKEKGTSYNLRFKLLAEYIMIFCPSSKMNGNALKSTDFETF